MKPAAFAYERATSVSQALERVQEAPGAKFLAGGQSLLAVMNYRLARPARLVDIGKLGELCRVFEEPESMLLGGLCRHRFVETDELIGRRLPLLREAAHHIGHVAIRNCGTLGGTIAHADPAAELPAALIALGASIFVERHGRQRRELAVADLYQGFYSTLLEDTDLITWVRVPTLAAGSGWGFKEVSRRHGDFAEAGCAAVVRHGEGGLRARLVLFGVADRPLLFERTLHDGDPESWSALAHDLASELEPVDRADYRRRLVAHCITSAGSDAQQRLSGEQGGERRV
ncbi:FAD binding domain-containing protein [Saccharopolyspora shandongensis]|uniref:FAD binding domain-containing protein n=1 Tax=Saccharopolyspora shandongensis TaxID=418495 RepID=UPI003404B8D3